MARSLAASSARNQLATDREKRDFARTPEPGPAGESSRDGRSYVVQQHAARQRHYDFRPGKGENRLLLERRHEASGGSR